ncbi:MAG: DMT family transporter [Pseudomonadota bacterium]
MYKATLAMLGAIMLWASSASASKTALAYISVPEGVAFRIIGAALLLWLIGFVILRRDYRLRSRKPLLMGVLEPALVTFFIMTGIAHTSAVNAAVVWGILPVTQPLLGRLFLGEPIQRSVAVGAVLAVGGTLLLFATKQSDGTGTLYGDLLLVCAVGAASINQMLARTVAKAEQNPLLTTSYQMVTASILAGGYLLMNLPESGLLAAVPLSAAPVFALLIITTAGPFFLYNYAMQTMPIGRISLFAPLSGPIGAVIATIVFSEPVNGWILLAISLSLSGALLPTLVNRLWRGPG